MSKISIKKITERIHDAVASTSGSEREETINQIVTFLAQKSLLGRSSEILARLEKALDADSGTIRATVCSRRQLTAPEVHVVTKMLKERYTSTNVILNTKEDVSLLGGVRIEVNDEVIDLSQKNKVQQLKTSLLVHN